MISAEKTTRRSTPDALVGAITEIVRELGEVRVTMPRCGSCGNFLAVVERVRGDLLALGREAGVDDVVVTAAGVAGERLGGWLDEARDRVKTTNHCEICVPTGPYERFATALGRPA